MCIYIGSFPHNHTTNQGRAHHDPKLQVAIFTMLSHSTLRKFPDDVICDDRKSLVRACVCMTKYGQSCTRNSSFFTLPVLTTAFFFYQRVFKANYIGCKCTALEKPIAVGSKSKLVHIPHSLGECSNLEVQFLQIPRM